MFLSENQVVLQNCYQMRQAGRLFLGICLPCCHCYFIALEQNSLFFKQGLGPLSLSLPLTANAQGQTMWTLPEKRLFRSYLRQAKSPKGEQNYFRPTAYLCPKPGKSPSCIPQEIYCLFSTHIGPLLGSGAFFPSYTPPVNAPNDIKLLNRSW